MTQAYNLSQFGNRVNTSGQASLTTAVTGVLPVANGGTGASTLTANSVMLGNGTGSVQFVAPSTSGNALVSNGTTWISSTPSAPAALSTASGSAPSYSTRAWVSFNGTGTVAIYGSANVSSITDNATGNYTINFSTAMQDTVFACVGSCASLSGTNGMSVVTTRQNSVTAPNTTTTQRIWTSTDQGNNQDVEYVNVIIIR
jgi:hypothetical protein